MQTEEKVLKLRENTTMQIKQHPDSHERRARIEPHR